MTAWLLTNPISYLCYLAAFLWFANGLRKAVFKPRVTYVSHQEVSGGGYLLTVKRQQLLPPWLAVQETWLLTSLSRALGRAFRESDGKVLEYTDLNTKLQGNLIALVEFRLIREKADSQAIADLEYEMAREAKLAETIAAAERKARN